MNKLNIQKIVIYFNNDIRNTDIR